MKPTPMQVRILRALDATMGGAASGAALRARFRGRGDRGALVRSLRAMAAHGWITVEEYTSGGVAHVAVTTKGREALVLSVPAVAHWAAS